MQKQKGYTMVEVMMAFSIIVIMAGISAPSFQSWQQDLEYIGDTESMFDNLADVRSSSISEKRCGDQEAAKWGVEITPLGVTVVCETSGGADITVRETEWSSSATVTTEHNVDVTNAGTWITAPTLGITVYPGGTQAMINDAYGPKWARISINFAKIGKVKTICYSRIANYPYFSKDGTCNDEN